MKRTVELHLLFDHAGHMPACAVITESKTSDIVVARKSHFAACTLLFDRGYVALDWLADLHHNGVLSVTRLKASTRFEVLGARGAYPQNFI